MRFPNIKNKNLPGVYKIENKINGKVYIGSAVNLKNRFYTHLYQLENDLSHNPHLQNSWNKWGRDNFDYTILEVVCNKHNLIKVEQDYIDKFPINSLYNIRLLAGNNLGIKFSEESKRKMSYSKPPNPILQIDMSTGKIIKLFRNIREVAKEMGVSAPTISSVCNNETGSSCGCLWVKVADYDEGIDYVLQYEKRWAKSVTDTQASFVEGRRIKVCQIHVESQTLVNVFDSMAAAAKFWQVSPGYFSKLVKTGKISRGHLWTTLSDYDTNNLHLILHPICPITVPTPIQK